MSDHSLRQRIRDTFLRVGTWLGALVHPERFDREMEEEMRLHRELKTKELRESGVADEEARYAAQRQMGNTLRLREESRGAWGWGWLEQFGQDLRYSMRMLRKSPGFTVIVVLTLALGIGVNTAIFSAVNGMILRPLPYPDSSRLMFLSENSKTLGEMSISAPDLKDWQDLNRVFTSMAGYRSERYIVAGDGQAELIRGAEVNSSLFATLSVQPLLGRTFRTEEDHLGGANVVVIGENLWKRRFASTPDIVGKGMNLDGKEFTVIGVMPSNFHFPALDSELWTALYPDVNLTETGRGNYPGIVAIARMKPGVSLADAQTEMTGVAGQLGRQYPLSNSGTGAIVMPLAQEIVGIAIRQALWLLLGAVGFVLLITCANIANLMLARTTGREREFATRYSLGASRSRILRHLITESLLISFIGGALGILLARWGLHALMALVPVGTPRVEEVRIDNVVLLFTLGVCIFAGLAFGLVPALQMARRPDLSGTLRESGRSSTGGVRHRRIRTVLVVAEIALSLILLVGAGLMLRSFENVQQASAGLDPTNVMTLQVSLDDGQYNSEAKFQNFLGSLLTRVKAMPGVESAATVSPLPVSGEGQFVSIAIEGHAPLPPGQYLHCDFAIPSVDYFQTMHIPLLRGRLFDEGDLADSSAAVIIDDVAARKYFEGEDPIGKRITYGTKFDEKRARTIVGIVRHVNTYGVDAPSSPGIYDMTGDLPFGALTILVRAKSDPAALVQAVRKEIAALDPAMPVFKVRPMTQVVASLSATRRLSSTLLGLFSVLALVVAAVGIYGVISYGVTQRSHEIGIRMALGAQPSGMLGMVVGEGLRLATTGVLIGWAGAWALNRVIAGQLFQVTATDPVTYLGMGGLLAIIAALACYIPARRAMHVDPIVALRHE